MDGTDDPENAGAGDPEESRGAPEGKRAPAPKESKYQALWVSYRDGVREKRALMRLHRMAWATVHTAVEYGWPEQGWTSLKDRAALWDRQALAAKQTEIAALDRAAAEAKGKRDAMRWDAYRPRAVELATKGHEVLEALQGKLAEAVKAATFVKYRMIRTVDPLTKKVVIEQKPYVDGVAVAQAVRLWSAAQRENGNVLAFLTGGPAGLPGDVPEAPELTTEQVAELNQGRLPEGVTLEMVAAAVMAQGKTGAGGGEE